MSMNTSNLIWDTTNGKWVKQVGSSTGAAHISIKDSLLGPEGSAFVSAITLSGTSQQTGVIAGDAIAVMHNEATESVFLAIGSNPTAAVNAAFPIPPNEIIYFPVTSGNKLAAIGTGTPSGTLWVQIVQ